MVDLTFQATSGRAHGKQAIASTLVAGWAAFGVTLSAATQLRIGGAPVGPGEAVLTLWMALVIFLLLRGRSFSAGHAFVGLTAYWLASLTLLALGAIVAVHTRKMDPSASAHDIVAFVYVSLLTCLLSLSLLDDGSKRYHWQMARMAFIFQAVCAGALIGATLFISGLGPIRLWYAGVRFRGWAENPNQMAIALAAMPFLGWYFMQRAPSVTRKAGYVLGIGLCVVAGIKTQSDALRLAWTVSVGIIALCLWHRAVVRGRARWLFMSHLVVPVTVVIAALLFGDQIGAYVEKVVESRYDDQDQGANRTVLWSHGLSVIAESPLVGFGPGPYSGKSGPFQGAEAHNSTIDWGMSTGFLGIVLHLSLLGWCAWRAIRSDSIVLLGMVTSLVILAQFHYSLRHPGYWLILVIALTLTERRAVAQAQPSAMFQPKSYPLPASTRARAALNRSR